MSPEQISVIPNLAQIKFGLIKLQKMGRMGSKEIYLIWAKFGITEICSGLIDITGSILNIKRSIYLHSLVQIPASPRS